ncbi:hypothetical protein TrST_g11959 [Triparma strigata]|uniref:Uncharacterized protein n=1 Tax=Triparma strigata TaxID=1606541 RepID=A0A9W7EJX0_9STRA|nr:hypothetical protein TrST_g11959 [Triparma strigata]
MRLKRRLVLFVEILLLLTFHPSSSFTASSFHSFPNSNRKLNRRHTFVPTSFLHSIRDNVDNSIKATFLSQGLSEGLSAAAAAGLSRANSRLVRKDRQRFVPQRYPLRVSIQHSPTRSWLKNPLTPQSTSLLTLNGTSLESSPANYDSVLWMDDKDKGSLAMEMVGEINTKSPAYLNVIREPRDDSEELWISDFSLTSRAGGVTKVHTSSGSISKLKSKFPWPNEVTSVPKHSSLMVTDGFLIPTKNDGAIYVLKNPGRNQEEKVKLTSEADWFYHRAVWVDLTGDGRQSVLTARARRTGMEGVGELVWLERPKPPRISEETGLGLELDGTKFDEFSPKNTPWKCRKLCDGPDVMFCLMNLSGTDRSIEVVSSQFFAKRVVLHSILRGDAAKGTLPTVAFERLLDDTCGPAYSAVLGDLRSLTSPSAPPSYASIIDSGSTASLSSSFAQEACTHLLVTSHECTYEDEVDSSADANLHDPNPDGGQLFSYEIPEDWKNSKWTRNTIAGGFKCRSNLSINPGAPGFPYLFYPDLNDRDLGLPPHIALSGDGSESAYIFRPDVGGSYSLMCEIDCGATVGSLAVSYTRFCGGGKEGYAKLFIAAYERDKVFVFSFDPLEV